MLEMREAGVAPAYKVKMCFLRGATGEMVDVGMGGFFLIFGQRNVRRCGGVFLEGFGMYFQYLICKNNWY